MLKKIIQFLYTLKHLKPTQLVFFVWRRGFATASIKAKQAPNLNSDLILYSPLATVGVCREKYKFNFLNLEKDISGVLTDWTPSDVSRLWRYNLHYFDYCRDNVCSESEKASLIEDWIIRNPSGSQPGWEPITCS